MDEEGSSYHSSTSSSKGEEEEELQRLKLDKQTSRVFLSGKEDDIKFFVGILKQQKWYKSSVIDGQISQVNFKYPILGQRVYDLVPKNMLNQQNNDSSLILIQQPQQQRLQIFSCKKTHYKLVRMKQQSLGYDSSLDNSLEQLRIKSNSNMSQPSSSPSSNISISNNNISNIVEEVKQIAQILSKQSQQNNAQMELIAKCLVQLVKQSNPIPNTIENNHPYEQQIKTSLQSSISQEANLLSINQGVQHQQESINIPNKVSQRINEMIADEGIFTYPELRKALQKEGYKDQDILATFVNAKHQIDTLIEIFKPNNASQLAQQQQQQQQQQQTSQTLQQNEQQGIQYPSFIQQGQFTQQQQQEIIEVEDTETSNSKNSNTAQQLTELEIVQTKDNEINTPSQINIKSIPISPSIRQKTAKDNWINRNRNEYEKKEEQKQMNSISNNPLSKYINKLSKSPNSQSRSTTPKRITNNEE